MKDKQKPFSWLAVEFDCNSQSFKHYNVLKNQEDSIKKLKKKFTTRETFEPELRITMLSRYWSKCEWECILKREGDRLLLYPWVSARDPEGVKLDVTDDEAFDWQGFADKHLTAACGFQEKIDVFDQLMYRWDEFVDFVWNYHHKWQRKK